jgi:hypothetical protein
LGASTNTQWTDMARKTPRIEVHGGLKAMSGYNKVAE